MVSIKLHLALMVASEFLGFLLGAVLVGAMWVSGLLGEQIWLVAVVALPTLLIGTLVPRFVFRKLISAKCPQRDCFGSAFAQDSKPIIYVCSDCGVATETNVSDGDGRTGNWH